ncbi:MAG: ribonuclease HI [Bacteroidota bacterium]|nr:ribonuclease HI [Bacteroidota bacterium]
MINHKGLTIYTDGAARGNPGRGGYGAILMWKGESKEISAGFVHTTNNRMELLSVIAALESLNRTGLDIEIYSDSKYVVQAVNEGWLENWMKNDFKGGKKNKDLWKRFYQLSKMHQLKFIWVKGHASNPYNQRCDELATAAADGKDLQEDRGYTENN